MATVDITLANIETLIFRNRLLTSHLKLMATDFCLFVAKTLLFVTDFCLLYNGSWGQICVSANEIQALSVEMMKDMHGF